MNENRSSNAESSPSFNCDAARSATEKAICASPRLTQLENAVSLGYKSVKKERGAEFAKNCNVDFLLAVRIVVVEISALKAD